PSGPHHRHQRVLHRPDRPHTTLPRPRPTHRLVVRDPLRPTLRRHRPTRRLRTLAEPARRVRMVPRVRLRHRSPTHPGRETRWLLPTRHHHRHHHTTAGLAALHTSRSRRPHHTRCRTPHTGPPHPGPDRHHRKRPP